MEKTESLQLPLLSKSSTKDARYIYYNNIAILISTTSFFYNILEGAVSVYFGEVNDSLSLFFFGVQSFVEVLSSVIVIWKVMTSYVENKHQIEIEKRATIFIGCLFIFLSIGILITGILSIINREYPTTTIPNIIVSAVATTIMLVLWLFKRKLAKELNSSTIQSDAQCSLACMRITIFLLIGSTIFHFWNEVWWIDGAMSLALGILFGKEGIQMLRWASSKDFNGGCCGGCGKLSVKVVPQKEYYGIQDEESVLQTEAPTAVKKGDGCCNKEGKCTKSAQGKNSSALTEATQAIPEASFFQKAEILEQKPQPEAQPKKQEVQSKKGGCCKGGGCTKNVTSQQTAPVEVIQVIPQVSLSQETQPIKTPGSCCKGGKCSKKEQKEALNEPIPEVSLTINENQVLTSQIIEEAPLQKPPGNCCKGGKCSKKTNENQNPTPVETVQVMPEVSLSQEAQPTKTPGSCCKGGKCSKKEQKPSQNEDIAEVSLTINENLVLISPQPVLTEEVAPVKSAGSCCKGGKCSKKAAEAISTRDQTEVSSLQSQLNESEVRA